MAALLQFSVPSATRDQFAELDDRVGQAMAAAGGPPAGLMAHVVHPEAEGFTITQVWRTEAEGHSHINNVVHPLLADLHLTPTETTTHPVWSFARP